METNPHNERSRAITPLGKAIDKVIRAEATELA